MHLVGNVRRCIGARYFTSTLKKNRAFIILVIYQMNGNARFILSGIHYLAWHTEEFVAMVAWMRAWNGTAPEGRRVTFLGVAGLQVLEAAVTRAGHERRRLALVSSSPTDLRILRLFGLDVRVPVYPRLSDAIREIASQVP